MWFVVFVLLDFFRLIKMFCQNLMKINTLHWVGPGKHFNWDGGYLPMSLALAAIGLRNSVTNFLASRRISIMLFSRAKSGARGKEATKRVTIPNWMTKRGKSEY